MKLKWITVVAGVVALAASAEARGPSEDEVWEFLKKNKPEHAEQMAEVKEQNPEAYEREMKKIARHMMERRKMEQETRQRMEQEKRHREDMARHQRAQAERQRPMATRPMATREAWEFAKRHLPHAVDDLERLERENPEMFRRKLEEIHKHMGELHRIRQHSPDVAEALLHAEKMEHESRKIAHMIGREKESGKRQEMTEKLEGILGQIFELRLKEGEFHLEQLEREISNVRDRLNRRKENRKRILEHRLTTLLAESDEDLRW
ncbi:MAG: hypothetical protein AAF492_03615 [Verrucomicrobiota bacterium]